MSDEIPTLGEPEDLSGKLFTPDDLEIDLQPIIRLSRDLAIAANTLGRREVAFLVSAYYRMQEGRIRSDHQIRQMKKVNADKPQEEPHALLAWFRTQSNTLEKQIQRALDGYTASHPVAQWMRRQKGIGPVISAGMLAHIDIEKSPSVGHIWRYAGLDPTVKWNKGEKRPWNAELKVICWKAGESFVKVSNHRDAFYGKLYKDRKAYEIARNERGDLGEQAATALKRLKRKDSDAYKAYSAGKLPPAHVHARATRYAVKMFLSHLHEKLCESVGRKSPMPFAMAFKGHVDYLPPPP